MMAYPDIETLMADDTTERGPRDRSKINVNEEYEVRYWTKELEVSEEELRRLVAENGDSVDAVRQAASRAD